MYFHHRTSLGCTLIQPAKKPKGSRLGRKNIAQGNFDALGLPDQRRLLDDDLDTSEVIPSTVS
jgi:hypothetical protein